LVIRPNADAEAIKKAFREAAKLHHPDYHPGDPDAPLRFRRIAAAYAVLHNAKRRAAYDRQLALKRKRIPSEQMHIVISGATYGAVGMALLIGFLSIGSIFSRSIMTNKVEMDTAHGPTEMADVQLAERSDATDRNGLRDNREVISERAIEPSVPGPVTDVTCLQAIAKQRPVRRALSGSCGRSPDPSSAACAHCADAAERAACPRA